MRTGVGSMSPGVGGRTGVVGEVGGDSTYSVDLWIEVWQLRTALLAWGDEVGKMEGLLVADGGLGRFNGGDGGTGARIRKRLAEIRAEYEVYVRECSMVIEGMALSAQLVSALLFGC
ncbi:hypothetical protein B0I37DRAFT_68383 [Chaetomium sp. MPI-CAGE-AT-0009]|nr:hypothetical protein B0I37DRAFT_68383 [Chaetomium sp. MPI-CAGE-AT-0009]